MGHRLVGLGLLLLGFGISGHTLFYTPKIYNSLNIFATFISTLFNGETCYVTFVHHGTELAFNTRLTKYLC